MERERVSGAERGDVTGWTDRWREHVRSMDGASVAVQVGRRVRRTQSAQLLKCRCATRGE